MQTQRNQPVIVKKADINSVAKDEVKEVPNGGGAKKEELIPEKYHSQELLQKSLDRNLLRLAELEKRIEGKKRDISDRKRWLELLSKSKVNEKNG